MGWGLPGVRVKTVQRYVVNSSLQPGIDKLGDRLQLLCKATVWIGDSRFVVTAGCFNLLTR